MKTEICLFVFFCAFNHLYYWQYPNYTCTLLTMKLVRKNKIEAVTNTWSKHMMHREFCNISFHMTFLFHRPPNWFSSKSKKIVNNDNLWTPFSWVEWLTNTRLVPPRQGMIKHMFANVRLKNSWLKCKIFNSK